MKLTRAFLAAVRLKRSSDRCSSCSCHASEGGLRGPSGMMCLACCIAREMGLTPLVNIPDLQRGSAHIGQALRPAFRRDPG